MKRANGEESTDVVEMDAMDVVEWERDQHTPLAPDTNMAALVKQSAQPDAAAAPPPPVPPRTNTTRSRTAMPVPLAPAATASPKQLAAVAPTAPSSRVPNATIPTPQPLMQQLLKTPTKHTTARAPRPANPTVPTPPALQRTAIQQSVPPVPPAPPVPTTDDGWEGLDDGAQPKSAATNIAAKAYSAPAIARTATPNTVRRSDRKPSAVIAAQPASIRAQTKLGTAPLPAVAQPAAKLIPKLEPSKPATPPPAPATPAAPPPALLAAPADRDEDWDGLAPSKPSKPTPAARPLRGDELDDDGEPREPSVIIDLNAKPVGPLADAIGGPTPLPMQTSELSTTASGAFVMPTATAPGGKSITSAPKRDPEPEDDLAIPVQPAPAWNAAAVTPLPVAPAFPSAPTPLAYPKAQEADAAWPPTAVAKPAGVAFAFAPATQQSAPPPRAPSATELGWEHDPGIPQALAGAEQTERRVAPRSLVATLLPTPKAKRVAVILASAATCLVLLLVVITSGGKSHAPPEPAVAPPAVVEATPPTPAPRPAPPLVTPAKPVEVAAAEPPAPVVEPVKPVPKPVVRRPAKPAKPLVLDYDKPKADAHVADTADQALAKARAAYAIGNQHLFAGHTDDAIGAYHQALAVYPNYVAGYRGLGLAYAQQGDRAAALKAFRTYVGLVPNAKDVALIQKRIARLSGQ